jgi:hypothetical protein
MCVIQLLHFLSGLSAKQGARKQNSSHTLERAWMTSTLAPILLLLLLVLYLVGGASKH